MTCPMFQPVAPAAGGFRMRMRRSPRTRSWADHHYRRTTGRIDESVVIGDETLEVGS